MKIVFRTDSSHIIASGHVERCLTLADYLKEQENECIFLCRDLEDNINKKVIIHNHRLIELPPPPNIDPGKLTPAERFLGLKASKDMGQTDSHLKEIGDCAWIITDHYGIDAAWQEEIWNRNNQPYLLAIDDMANRDLFCDILLDQNCNLDKHRYDLRLKKEGCVTLLGPAYALLRPEFYETRETLRKRDGECSRVFVFYGGVDSDNATLKTLRAIHLSNLKDKHIDVLVGGKNPHSTAINEYAGHMRDCVVHKDVKEISTMMADADIAFGGGGVTALERAYLGLPSFITVLAENQRPGTECLAEAGAAWNLGENGDIDIEAIKLAIDYQVTPDALRQMSSAAIAVFGKGKKNGVEKVYKAMKDRMHHGRS